MDCAYGRGSGGKKGAMTISSRVNSGSQFFYEGETPET